jgi:hypothetical protein
VQKAVESFEFLLASVSNLLHSQERFVLSYATKVFRKSAVNKGGEPVSSSKFVLSDTVEVTREGRTSVDVNKLLAKPEMQKLIKEMREKTTDESHKAGPRAE